MDLQGYFNAWNLWSVTVTKWWLFRGMVSMGSVGADAPTYFEKTKFSYKTPFIFSYWVYPNIYTHCFEILTRSLLLQFLHFKPLSHCQMQLPYSAFFWRRFKTKHFNCYKFHSFAKTDSRLCISSKGKRK